MVERVFWHIGMPKTGTTYLQDIVWTHRESLRLDGLTLPGSGHREHLWAALDVQERTHLERRHPRAPGTFARLCEELAGVSVGDGLLSHEFFCGASAEQARRAVQRLAPAEVHLVVTARHTAGMLTAGWQEMVKNGSSRSLRATAADRERPDAEFSWATWDLAGIIERWGSAVPPERIHVLPVPPAGEPRSRHWEAFAGVLGVATSYAAPERAANPSLGAAEVELLRRLNRHLDGFRSPTDRGEWIRGYLAERRLRGAGAAVVGLEADLLADCRARSRRAIDLIAERRIHVVGDPERLAVPDDLPPGRSVDSVSDEELLEAAGGLVAAMLGDVRDLTRRLGQLGQGAEPGGADGEDAGRRGWRRVLGGRRRSGD